MSLEYDGDMTRQPKILIIDEDRNALDALAELLRDAGYDVATATTNAEAAVNLVGTRPDVVLKQIRIAGSAEASIEWTILDGEVAPQQVLMSTVALPRGLNIPWVKKPIDLDELLALLSRLIGRSG